MMHGKAIWKPGIRVIAKASSGISRKPYNGDLQHPIWTPSCKGPTCWRTGYGAWLMAVKFNPLWKTKVSISTWIKPCCPMSLFCITKWGLELFSVSLSAWFLKKNICHVAFYEPTKLTCLIVWFKFIVSLTAFTSWYLAKCVL